MEGFYSKSSPMAAVLDRLRGPDMDEHLELFNNIEWAATSLGPLDSWPQELATQIFLTMLVTNPQCLLLGKDRVVIYNQAYGRLIRDYHPRYFGLPLISWVEWQPYMEGMLAIYAEAESTGRAWVTDSYPMVMASGGFKENVHMTCTVICLPPPLHGILGIFTETTATVTSEQRSSALNDLTTSWETSSDLGTLWNNILTSISSYPELFPFAFIYYGNLPPENDNRSDSSGNDLEDFVYTLKGITGHSEASSPQVPRQLDLDGELGPFTQYFKSARATRTPVFVAEPDIPIAWQDVARSRGVREACRGAVVCPSSTNQLSKVDAFLVLGLSTRDSYNDSYREWTFRLQREFADTVASINSAQEAARKKKETARRLRIEKDFLNKELALRKREAELATVRVERITKIVGLADVALFERDLDGRLVFANDAYYRLIPRTTDDDGPAPGSCIPLEHWNSLLQGESRSYEIQCANKDWALCSAQPTRNENGNIDAIIGIITNIQHQKSAEQEALLKLAALEKAGLAERRMYRFLEMTPCGICILKGDRQVSFATNEWFKLTGHEPCDLDQINWNPCIVEEDREFVQSLWDKLTVELQPVHAQFRVHRPWINPDGEHCGNAWVLLNAIPELNDDGSVDQVVSAITDISHLKYAESIQRTRVEEAVESRKHMLSFIDLTSHEIRNPLGAIVHCADSALESLSDIQKSTLASTDQTLQAQEGLTRDPQKLTKAIETGLDAVETILSCAAHLKRIVDDTLTLSKLDANLLRISPSPTKSLSILSDIRRMSEVEAERLGINLSTIADPSLKTSGAEWTAIDPGRVMQVLINLVTNAMKFTTKPKDDGSSRDVTIRMGASIKRPLDLQVDFSIARAFQDSIYDTAEFSEHTCYLWFTVEDTGIGMNEEEKNRIFSRFAQGSVKTYSQYGGSGLGLFISRTLVELQGGEIGVASTAGKGSRFAFFIKAHKSAPPSTQNGDPMSRIPSPSAHVLKPGKIPVSVLIVEDNAVNQRVLEKQLSKKGYICYVANHGQDALDLLKTTKLWKGNEIDLAAPNIDDVEMPVMNGLECARRIREYQRTGEMRSNLPIIAASANARVEQIGMAIEAGMDDSITKPFRIPELTPKIDSFAAWARAQG
ncbi:hypothetical protein D6C78_01249 [Aureobasidium pullulans]|uniref:Histidine kinase HHK15p n=1 Tax=Aureobasidium pullulans TaxID=5580 RepID=A0A4T0C4X4_AURPU|nr:hypothetical protein D6C78_01249 [Aureobasidium pullulans]